MFRLLIKGFLTTCPAHRRGQAARLSVNLTLVWQALACSCSTSTSTPGPVASSDSSVNPTQDTGVQDAEVQAEKPPGYAEPGTEVGVPGPSTRLWLPEGSVFDLRYGPDGWLYANNSRGITRVPAAIEDAPKEQWEPEWLGRGRFAGPWFAKQFVYWVNLKTWQLMRWPLHKRLTPEDSPEAFDLGLTPPTEKTNLPDVSGYVHGDSLYLAREGCVSIARVSLDGHTQAVVDPAFTTAPATFTPTVWASDQAVCCFFGNGYAALFKTPPDLSSVEAIWTLTDEGLTTGTFSPVARTQKRMYWTVSTGVYPTPTLLFAYDDEAGKVIKLPDLLEHVPKSLKTDREGLLYSHGADLEAEQVLQRFDIEARGLSEIRANFEYEYTDEAGVKLHTHIRAFTLGPDAVYWLRGNPGSRPGAGDEIMRLPRAMIDEL